MAKRSDERRKVSTTQASLVELQARDEWQSRLITCDGALGGVVVRKVIEPASYMVRYLVVYQATADRHLLVPASTITGADLEEVHCILSSDELERLPVYSFTPITRLYEEQVYGAIARTPHWVEERRLPT